MSAAVHLIDPEGAGRSVLSGRKPLAEDRAELVDSLDAVFGWAPLDDRAVARAWEVQRELTEKGRHRSAGAVDLLVAATAELQGLTLLHYDHDFEAIASVTGQQTQGLAAPGTL
ncbi:PIN domain-containing protein [Streptomyces antibioticus]|uniref:PIN domain-containing protein n=1 Tax=Streptomyces antibioticus TaxID=1890 RepID=UPI0036A43BBC